MKPPSPILVSETRSFPKHLVDPTTGAPVRFTVEHRHTIYVSGIPHDQVHPEAMKQLLKLAEIPEKELEGVHTHRRATSLQEPERPAFEWKKGKGREDVGVRPSPTRSEPPLDHRKPPSPAVLKKPRSGTPPNTPATYAPPPCQWATARPRILFYHKHQPHYGFTNFSPHPVVYNNKLYPTSEHLFQSFKFQGHRPLMAEHIRTCSDRPSVAFSEARRFQPEVRSDWLKVNISKMDETLWHKFTQHRDLKEELLATGDAELVENSDKDSFWGVGADGKGRNELGEALERLRAQLRQARF